MKTHWTTKITKVNKPHSFVDVQEKGPYALWEHQHNFKQAPDGTLMTDIVRYAIPYGWLGRIANAVFVERELNAIFEFRSRAVTNYFLNRKHL
jgi:ligand-binding SRPBCC domain-containing protein